MVFSNKADFLLSFLKKCKQRYLHVTLDTCGFVEWRTFKKIVEYIDKFIFQKINSKRRLTMLLLSRSDIQKSISIKEAIQVVKYAFAAYSSGKVTIPVRIQIKIPQEDEIILYMPGYIEDSGALGLKIVSVFPKNREKNLPTTNAFILLIHPETGLPLAGLEGNYLTALRTGAASGVATDYLASKNSSTVAIIGAGFQARTQLEAMCSVRDIKSINIYDINEQQSINYLELMKNELSNLSLKWTISPSSEKAIENADIICVTTTSKTPVFSGEKIKLGTHINAVGSFTPQTQEIDIQTLLKADKIYVDSIEATLKEAGDFIIPIQKGQFDRANITGEIGEIISHQKIGRENKKEITIFKTVGLSIQDMATGFFIYQKAKKLGLGEEFSLD